MKALDVIAGAAGVAVGLEMFYFFSLVFHSVWCLRFLVGRRRFLCSRLTKPVRYSFLRRVPYISSTRCQWRGETRPPTTTTAIFAFINLSFGCLNSAATLDSFDSSFFCASLNASPEQTIEKVDQTISLCSQSLHSIFYFVFVSYFFLALGPSPPAPPSNVYVILYPFDSKPLCWMLQLIREWNWIKNSLNGSLLTWALCVGFSSLHCELSHTDKWFLRDRICISRMTMLNAIFSGNFSLRSGCSTANGTLKKMYRVREGERGAEREREQTERWLLAMDKWQIFAIRRRVEQLNDDVFRIRRRRYVYPAHSMHTKLLNWLPFLSHFRYSNAMRVGWPLKRCVVCGLFLFFAPLDARHKLSLGEREREKLRSIDAYVHRTRTWYIWIKSEAEKGQLSFDG